MPDTLTKAQRTKCMRRVRVKNTKPELELRRALWNRGLRYRLNRKIYGKPDLVFPGPRVAVFVDGCFWHGCKEHGSMPQTNKAFWRKKIERNIERDIEVNNYLSETGWEVLRFCSYEIASNLDRVTEKIKCTLR